MANLQNTTTGSVFASTKVDANTIESGNIAFSVSGHQLNFSSGVEHATTRRLNFFGSGGAFRGSLIASIPNAVTDDSSAGAYLVRNRFIIQSELGAYSVDKSTYGFSFGGLSSGFLILPPRSIGSEWRSHIIQWGSISVALNSASTISFPIAYDSVVIPSITTAISAPTTGSADNLVTIDAITNTSVTLRNTGASGVVANPCQLYYRAVGYRRTP